MRVGPNQHGLAAKNMREANEASPRRLEDAYVDLDQMGHISRHRRLEEFWQAMDLLMQQGKPFYVGSSNFTGWHFAQANELAKPRGTLGLVPEQSRCDLLKLMLELEVIPASSTHGAAPMRYSPLGDGKLCDRLRQDARRCCALGAEDSRIAALRSPCASRGRQPGDVALWWVAGRPGVTAPVAAPRALTRFEANLAALEAGRDVETLCELDEILPGPRWPAPDACVW